VARVEVCCQLRYFYKEIMVVFPHEVPRIGMEPVIDISDEARGTKEVYTVIPSQGETYEVVEADKVIHMGVGDESMRNFQDLARRQG